MNTVEMMSKNQPFFPLQENEYHGNYDRKLTNNVEIEGEVKPSESVVDETRVVSFIRWHQIVQTQLPASMFDLNTQRGSSHKLRGHLIRGFAKLKKFQHKTGERFDPK